ncbi:MAG: HAD family hydrolase [Acidimicrobiales bacterium]
MTAQLPEFDGVTLDVGGVFVVPRHDRLLAALATVGITCDADRLWDGHYLAMHAVDAEESEAETFDTYVPAFCHHLGLRDDDLAKAVEVIEPMFGPSGLWSQPIAESVDALRALHAAGIPMAVVSNADGTVASVLAEAGVCQVGDGPHVPVLAIVDSGALGVAKPDPATFAPALEAFASLGIPADRVLHVGDSVHYDVLGAEAAGMAAVHFDPRRLCGASDHAHIQSLVDLLA